MPESFVAIIPARGGSRGVPRKNIIDFHGKPLIAWSIEDSLNSKYIEKVFVSTDDEEIASISRKFGAEVIIRPAEFSTDAATSESVLKHAIISKDLSKCEYIIFLQATSPLREASDLDDAVDHIRKEQADSLFSGSYVGEFNLWRQKAGKLLSVNYDYKNRLRRQDAEQAYGKQYLENGSFYIFKPKTFLGEENRLGGRIVISIQEDWKSLQIDSYDELELCKNQFREKLAYKIAL
jgi:N-acylneuraminate cytidylyltransferase